MRNLNYVVKNVRYTETRRGVNAYAQLWQGTLHLADIEDVAENIVCGLYFRAGIGYAGFVAAARRALPQLMKKCDNDNYIVGEYARLLISQAEENNHAE